EAPEHVGRHDERDPEIERKTDASAGGVFGGNARHDSTSKCCHCEAAPFLGTATASLSGFREARHRAQNGRQPAADPSTVAGATVSGGNHMRLTTGLRAPALAGLCATLLAASAAFGADLPSAKPESVGMSSERLG